MAFSYVRIALDGQAIRYDYDREVPERVEDLRGRFNRGYYWDTAEAGGYGKALVYEALAARDSDLPTGTLSQILLYHSQGSFVAEVHQYLLPGERRDTLGRRVLGGSGMPDPKAVQEERTYYHLPDRPPPRRQPRWSR